MPASHEDDVCSGAYDPIGQVLEMHGNKILAEDGDGALHAPESRGLCRHHGFWALLLLLLLLLIILLLLPILEHLLHRQSEHAMRNRDGGRRQ